MTDPVPVANQVLSALGNGLYQGLILTAVVWVGLRLFARINATTRYAIEFTTLLIVAVLPFVHWIRTGFPPAHAPPLAPQTSAIVPAPDLSSETSLPASTLRAESAVPAPAQALDQPLSGPPDLERSWPAIQSVFRCAPADVPAAAPLTPPGAEEGSQSEEQDLAGDLSATSPLQAPDTRLWQPAFPERASLFLVITWVGIASLGLARLAWQLHLLFGLLERSEPAPIPLQALFGALRRAMQVRRNSELLVSGELSAPVAAGCWRSTVILPEQLLDAADVRWERVLRHELAHLRRHDDWTNLVQQVIGATLFFHPAVWWLCRRLNLDREIACDDHVLAAMHSPRDYALFLTDFASRMRSRRWAVASAAWTNKSQLKERICMILDTKRNVSTRLASMRVAAIGSMALVAAALAFWTGPRLAIAEDDANALLPDDSAEAAIADTESADEDAVVAETTVVTKTVPVTSSITEVTTPVVATLSLTSDAPKIKDRVRIKSRLDDGDMPVNPDAAPRAMAVPAPAINVTLEPPTPPRLPRAPRARASINSIPAAPVAIANVDSSNQDIDDSKGKDKEKLKDKHAEDGRADRLERRLSRLERLMETLINREESQATRESEVKRKLDTNRRDADGRVAASPRKQAEQSPNRHNDLAEADGSHDELSHALEQVNKDMQRVFRQAERAKIEAQKAAETQHFSRMGLKGDDSINVQRKLLEEQRRSLRNKMEEVEAQLKRLSEQVEKSREDAERSSRSENRNRNDSSKNETN